MAKLSYKVSYYLFYVLMALILIVLGLFFCVGYDNMQGEYNAPEHTETLMYLMYGMIVLGVVVTVGDALMQFVAGLKDNPKGAVKSLVSLALFVAVIVIAYGMASDAPLTLANGEEFTDTMLLKLSDTIIYVIYFLLVAAGAVTLINLSGIFKK